MPRLIDADKLSEWIADQFCEDMPKHWDRTAEAILEHMNEMPTAKPSQYGQCWGCKCEAIKPGHWKRVKAYPNIIICDECGEAFEQREYWNYCPNCGATMDKERREDAETY